MILRLVPALYALCAAAAVLAGAYLLVESAHKNLDMQERSDVGDRLALVAATLSQTVNVRLNHTRSLAAFVKTMPAFTQADFDAFASFLQDDLVGLRSLQLAPGGVVRYLTNLERNRAALGHDLFADPDRRPAVELAVRERRYIIAGPVDLVQGGQAIIARRPIFNADDTFWGFATVLIDVEPLLKDAGYLDLAKDYRVAIRGKDGMGAGGAVFHGSADVFDESIGLANVVLPNGSWQLGAAFDADHHHEDFVYSTTIWIVAAIVATMMAVAAQIIADRPRRLELAVERATADLVKARDAAEAANRAKSEFVAVVSHELRTPLTSIKGSLELMRAEVAGGQSETSAKLVELATRNARRLMLLVNDLLDMNKMLSGELVLSHAPVSVEQLLDDALAVNTPYAESFGIRLAIDDQKPGNAAGAVVAGDKNRLDQTLTNLISNAVKFSPSGQTVTIGAALTEDGGAVVIAVADNGTGIAEAFRERIFDRFTQADSSDDRAKGGTGLGLYICKRIIEQHGGAISFETETGKGTTFFVTLPL